MITAIRDVRRAKGLTLDEVAKRCDPPTTPQTIGRLETGARTVSIGWLNRIAAALGVEAAELVAPLEVPIVALLDRQGAHEPDESATATAPIARDDLVAIKVRTGTGKYRAGDILWCVRMDPEALAAAIDHDVLAATRYGQFVFGQLIQRRKREIVIAPIGGGAPRWVTGPLWVAQAETLIRAL